jgi:5,10-methylenetetrahydrofolate reductase
MIIGGCCGTTPVEIAAIRSAVEEARVPRTRLDFEERELVVALGEEQRETGLARALRENERVVTIQLDPPLGGSSKGLVELSRALAQAEQVGFVDINDNATARAGMSSLMVAAAIERQAGIETIPHLTTRDASVMGLESMLLGAHAEGVRNILAITGDPPEVGDYPGARGVYEIDSIGLTQLMTNLNRGEDFNGRPIDAPTSFFPGVAVNPTADDVDVELARFQQKVDAGAKFAITQIVFDIERLDAFLERLGGEWPIPVLIELFPLTSYRLALRLHNEVPGIVVPEALQQALEEAGPDAPKLGFEHARGLLEEARGRGAGVCLVAPFRRPLDVLDLLD